MKIALGTIEVDDRVRRALARHYGQRWRLATREDVRAFLMLAIDSAIETLVSEHDADAERET